MHFPDIKNILLIQLGDIGDVIWAVPTFWAVKSAYPQARLSLLLREGNACLVEADPAVDDVIEVRKHRGCLHKRWRDQFRFLRDFRSRHFDLVIDLRADERGAFMARLSGAPYRVALYYDGLSRWRNPSFTHLIRPAKRITALNIGAAVQSLRIVWELGMEAPATVPQLWLRPGVNDRVRVLLKEEGISDLSCWCSLNPFSRWSYKELAYGKWVEIIDWLWDEFGMATVLVGSPAERKKAAELAAACTGQVFNLAGRTSLAELAGVLSLSRLHIGVDSAAPHIAAAVGTGTVTVYGPSDWHDWAPRGERHRVVTAEGDCVPCHRKGCDNSNVSKCLENLAPERLKNILREVLTEGKMTIGS